MTGGWRWRDAERRAADLATREPERLVLDLLARLPLAAAAALIPFVGSPAASYRALGHLRDAGLVEAIRPVLHRGHGPRLWYLTDSGLAAVALDRGVPPGDLAGRWHLRGADLLGRLPGLPQLVAAYEILRALAASRPDRPRLVDWERPWRRRFWRPGARTPGRVSLPAAVSMSWDGDAGIYLLLPDLGNCSPRAWWTTFSRLVVLRAIEPDAVPPLLIVTASGRGDSWRRLLDEAARNRGEAPLPALVVPWSELPAALGRLPLSSRAPMQLSADGLPAVQVRRRGGDRLPRLVGEALHSAVGRSGPTDDLGRIALGLTAADRELLDFLGRHPFLDPRQVGQISRALGIGAGASLQRLIAAGLVTRVVPEQPDTVEAGSGLLELTRAGLKIVAAQQGVSLGGAVRFNGLVGGGAERPLGPRGSLWRNLAHTRGVDALFIRLACQLANGAEGDALVEWRNAASCGRRAVRPDGYGIVRYRGEVHGFFLEYDRGTMRALGYQEKLSAYRDYLASGRFERDYAGFPTILMVTVSDAVEERIARVARAAMAEHGWPLPLLLTVKWRIDATDNPDGLLGPIWREPSEGFGKRQRGATFAQN